jgi:hypothetical protein
MSYDFDTIYNGICGILKAQALTESKQAYSFKDASVQEYGNCFILTPMEGAAGEANDTQAALLYDTQMWSVQVALAKGSQSEMENLKALHRKREKLMRELDDPSNWLGIAHIVRYVSWDVTNEASYYVLRINIRIINPINYQ